MSWVDFWWPGLKLPKAANRLKHRCGTIIDLCMFPMWFTAFRTLACLPGEWIDSKRHS